MSTNKYIIWHELYPPVSWSRQEAQLPQRNSASATHVFLGWLTDRAIHWKRQIIYCTTWQAKVVSTASAQKAHHTLYVRPSYVDDEAL